MSMDIASFRSQRESELGGLTPDTSLIDANSVRPSEPAIWLHVTRPSSRHGNFDIFRDDAN